MAPLLESDEAVAYVNGKRYLLPKGRAECTLLQWLRELGLTGTKLGCGEGGCGACTVMLSSLDPAEGKVVNRAVNACLFPLYAAESCHVVTVEGIGSVKQGLHPIQKRMVELNGSQCGFCTPGFVMSMYALLRSSEEGEFPTELEIEEALSGNLCRCTGYRPILEAFRVFSKGHQEKGEYTKHLTSQKEARGQNGHEDGQNGHGGQNGHENGQNGHGGQNGDCGGSEACLMGDACCKKGGADGEVIEAANGGAGGEGFTAPPSEPIFPVELRKKRPGALHLPGPRTSWFRPITLAGLLALKRAYPESKLVCGNSEVGIEMAFMHRKYPVLISPTRVPEMTRIEQVEGSVRLGASVTLTAMMERMKEMCGELPAHQTSGLSAIIRQLKWFAGAQIKNVATIGGNIATGSPISDLNPLWMALGATFVMVSEGAPERRVLARDFFLGYRKVDMQAEEVLLRVDLPLTRELEYGMEFKQAHRREDDISIVCAGMRARFEKDESGIWAVQDVALAYGGVAAKTVMAPRTEQALRGKPWTRETLRLAVDSLREEISIASNAPGGMVEFRRSLVTSFFFKFFVATSMSLSRDSAEDFAHCLALDELSAAKPYDRPASSGVQCFDYQRGERIVGKPVPHTAAALQCSGEAQYCDDVTLPANALHSALVFSQKAHAKLLSVDASEALTLEGVVGFYSAADVPGGNDIGPVIPDEECFASQEVTCVGQVIGIVVAETEAAARAGARAVRVDYEDLPAIMTIEEAIEQDSFFDTRFEGHVECGDVDACFASGDCDHVVEGEVRMGGQDHFYLETNACVVIPLENDEVMMYASTQCPSKHQKSVSHVLGVAANKVVCKAKRLGGGFGGKETRSVFLNCAAAVPAYLTGRPVRLCLNRDEDMQSTGHRHPFLGKYKVGFTKEGKLLAADVRIYNNGGNTLDLSAAVMQRAVLHADNCYRIPHCRFHGKVCKTNTSSNSAFRGFGGPQGMFMTETWMDHVARELGMNPEQVREANLYQEGDAIPCGTLLERHNVPRMWAELQQSCAFPDRKRAVEEYNLANRHRKRGIAVVPTKFGIAFTLLFYNQGGALVHLYTDGTVLVTHGGVEMGQGLHTKVAQIAADELGVPLSDVFIAETSTDKVPNASPTAASASSDLYGAAVLDACQQLTARLCKYRKAAPPGTKMSAIATSAYQDRVDLSAHGFYKTPDIKGYGTDRPFQYFTYGVACTEVEVDVLTGDLQVLRTDILMDVGNSINPGLDVGQIEGAFVQGLGLMTTEELVWGDAEHPWVRPGILQTKGPGTYKIPTANDIPVLMNVSLLQDAPNPNVVASSKAIGEPPLFMASSAFFAIKEALYAARCAAGQEGYFKLNSPATPEKIRMAVVDEHNGPFVGWGFQTKASV